MPKHMVSCAAKCPYYCCEDRHEIFCEGLSDGMRTHVAFASPAERKLWMTQHCKSIQGYKDCPVMQMLEKTKSQKAD